MTRATGPETSPFPRTVLWMRGDGCRDLAELLASVDAVQVTGDPREAAIENRADLVVMKKPGSLDLLPVAAPNGFDPSTVSHVTAAVGEGPHSALAATIAMRVATALSVSAEAVIAVPPETTPTQARAVLDRADRDTGIGGRIVETDSAPSLVESIDPAALLVLGAPGGSWLNRQFFGPGARLRAQAPAATIVVRDAPIRAFQLMAEPSCVGPHLLASDALAVVHEAVTPIVEEGQLIGILRKERLADADPGTEIGDLSEEPVFVEAVEPVSDLGSVRDFYRGATIPLVDRDGRLVGRLDPVEIAKPHPRRG